MFSSRLPRMLAPVVGSDQCWMHVCIKRHENVDAGHWISEGRSRATRPVSRTPLTSLRCFPRSGPARCGDGQKLLLPGVPFPSPAYLPGGNSFLSFKTLLRHLRL